MSHKPAGKSSHPGWHAEEERGKQEQAPQDPTGFVAIPENPGTLQRAREAHLKSKGETVVRHPGADSNASDNLGTLNQQ